MEKETSDNMVVDDCSRLWLLEEAALRPPQDDPLSHCRQQDTLQTVRRRLLAQCLVLALVLAFFTPVCAKGTTVFGGRGIDHPTDMVAQIIATP